MAVLLYNPFYLLIEYCICICNLSPTHHLIGCIFVLLLLFGIGCRWIISCGLVIPVLLGLSSMIISFFHLFLCLLVIFFAIFAFSSGLLYYIITINHNQNCNQYTNQAILQQEERTADNHLCSFFLTFFKLLQLIG